MMSTNTAIVGLDFGQAAVKAVWIQRTGKILQVIKTERLNLAAEDAANASLLTSWLKRQIPDRTPCVLALPSQQAVFQPVLLPPDDPRTLAQAAAMEVLRFNEMAAESMHYAYTSFDSGSDDKAMLLTLARPAVVSRILDMDCLQRLAVLDLVPTAAALHALRTQDAAAGQAEHCSELVVSIGHACTDISIHVQGRLAFARSISIGGRMLTETLMQGAGISRVQAETRKTTSGLTDPNIRSLLAPAMDMWFSELKSCLDVFCGILPQDKLRPTAILLTGGGSRLAGLAEELQQQFQIPCSNLTPGPALRDLPEPDVTGVAAGLACSALQKQGASCLSLLPQAMRDEQRFRQQKPYWIGAGVTAAMILGISLVGGARDIQRKQEQLALQRASLRKRQQLAQDIDSIKQASENLRALAAPLRTLVSTAPVLRDLLTILAEARNPQDWITMVCDAEFYFNFAPITETETREQTRTARRASASPRPSPAVELRALIVEGYTLEPSLETVRELLHALHTYDAVEQADILSDDRWRILDSAERHPPHPKAKRFVIEIRLRQS